MEAVARPERMTVQEFFRREAESAVRHEYVDGVAIAMAGGTYHHSLICTNVSGELRSRLRGKSCRALESNLLIRIPRKAKYYYGDVPVVCGDPQFDPVSPPNTAILNPRLIVEVLSDSTERFDRGDKFTDYREIDTLREYVLVAQHTPRVETYLRLEDGNWRFSAKTGIDAIVSLDSIGVDLPLAEVYADVTFPSSAA